jgi:hypothetical protein
MSVSVFRVHVSLRAHVSVRILPCLFQQKCLATDNFQAYLLYCQKKHLENLEVTFVANGQLSALITQG